MIGALERPFTEGWFPGPCLIPYPQPLSTMNTGEAGTPSINLVASNPLRLLA